MLDQLLLVLMLVEILHTVRTSIRSHILFTAEPFLVVGLIASIRRILVITLEAATLTKEGKWSTEAASIFRASMIELGLLGLLILILVSSIMLLRRRAPAPKELKGACTGNALPASVLGLFPSAYFENGSVSREYELEADQLGISETDSRGWVQTMPLEFRGQP